MNFSCQVVNNQKKKRKNLKKRILMFVSALLLQFGSSNSDLLNCPLIEKTNASNGKVS